MRFLIGITLSLIGAAIMLYGIGFALRELVGLYQGALDQPLNQPEAKEQAVSAHMVRYLIIGAVGIPVLLAGNIISRTAWRRRRLKR